MKNKEGLELIVRYCLLLVLASGNLYLFYLIFTPLTLFPVYFLLQAFFEPVYRSGDVIIFARSSVQIVAACVAGSAYYLLLIFNLTTPMPIKKRMKSMSFLILSFLVLNILRIFVFSLLVHYEFRYFDITHEAVWYIGSTLFIVFLWFYNIYLFRIKAIPVYTDLKTIAAELKQKK